MKANTDEIDNHLQIDVDVNIIVKFSIYVYMERLYVALIKFPLGGDVPYGIENVCGD